MVQIRSVKGNNVIVANKVRKITIEWVLSVFVRFLAIKYEIAKNITEPYDSICDFCKHFIDNKEEFISNIEKIQYKTKTGNLKKITKKQIEKIIKNLNFSI